MTDSDCPICGNSFTSETGVRDHTWDVHRACHHCGEQFDHRTSLYTHWLERHEEVLSEESRKRAERKVGDRTLCPSCGERFGSGSAVRDHAWDVHGVCDRCGESFDDRRGLDAHRLSVHGGKLSRSERASAEATVGELTFADRLRYQGLAGAVTGVTVSRRALVGGGVVGLGAAIGGGFLTAAFGGGGSDGSGLAGHPAASALASQPTLGSSPSEASGTIIAFEDPSCPSCARFELGTFPQLESELIDQGQLSFVYRGIPVVYPWGEPAVLALEATYSLDETAFWALKDYYYRSQNRIDGQNVRAATRQFLADETSVDAESVIEAVDQATHRDAVDADLQASRDAGVRGTPTFFLFKDGSFVTDVVGPQPYEVFKNSLGL